MIFNITHSFTHNLMEPSTAVEQFLIQIHFNL